MSDELGRFIHGITEEIINLAISEAEDVFYESDIDTEEQIKQEPQSAAEEIMYEPSSSNRGYVEGNDFNIEDQLTRNEDDAMNKEVKDSAEWSALNETLGDCSKHNTGARNSNIFVYRPTSCYSGSHISSGSEKKPHNISTGNNKDSMEQNNGKLESANETNPCFANTKSIGPPDIPDDLCIKFEALLGMDRDATTSAEVLDETFRNKDSNELSGFERTGAINQIIEHQRVSMFKVSIRQMLMVDISFPKKQELNQRRIGMSDLQGSLSDLDTTDFDQRNAVTFGLPNASSEIGYRRKKDTPRDKSPDNPIIKVSSAEENLQEFAKQQSTSAVKRRRNSQPEEPNAKFRKRPKSSTDAEICEKTEMRNHIRSTSAGGSPKCNASEEIKGADVTSKDAGFIEVLRKRKRGVDESLKKEKDEPSFNFKKLREQDELNPDFIKSESEFSDADSN